MARTAQTEMTTAEIKVKYGASNIISIDNDGEKIIGYLKKPERAVLAAAMSKYSSDPLGSNEILLKNCLIREVSDSRILEDEDVFVSALTVIGNIISLKTAELKKI